MGEIRAKYEGKLNDCNDLLAVITENNFKIAELERELKHAQWESQFQKRKVEGMKFREDNLRRQVRELESELESIKDMSMFEFGNAYCSDESLEADGKAFARALLGGA